MSVLQELAVYSNTNVYTSLHSHWPPCDLSLWRQGQRLNPRMLAGQALKTCVDQLAGVFKDIFILFLPQSELPTCFKGVTVPKKSMAICINYYCLVVVIKCFDRLNMAQFNSPLRNDLPIATAGQQQMLSHSVLDHLDNKNTYIRLLLSI